jgi:hypothetical protein
LDPGAEKTSSSCGSRETGAETLVFNLKRRSPQVSLTTVDSSESNPVELAMGNRTFAQTSGAGMVSFGASLRAHEHGGTWCRLSRYRATPKAGPATNDTPKACASAPLSPFQSPARRMHGGKGVFITERNWPDA